jgi:hypothetical protein
MKSRTLFAPALLALAAVAAGELRAGVPELRRLAGFGCDRDAGEDAQDAD